MQDEDTAKLWAKLDDVESWDCPNDEVGYYLREKKKQDEEPAREPRQPPYPPGTGSGTGSDEQSSTKRKLTEVIEVIKKVKSLSDVAGEFHAKAASSFKKESEKLAMFEDFFQSKLRDS